ncbi:MAG: rhomboid family intramembrane serine protease [Firmicutes bacterium]|nr:rhomboid family intramembrane serine protease [Bacillota bacterium]
MNTLDKIKQYYKHHPVTSTILIINLVMAIIVFVEGNFSLITLVKYGALYPPLITEYQEYYRLVTVMFLHGSILHFLMNSIALYYLGGQMELIIGPRKYAFLYFLSGIGSSLLVVFAGPGDVVTVGASGAIFGVMGGMLMLTFLRTKWFNERAVRSIRQLMVINLVFTFVVPNISIAGHIGGLVIGILLFYVITPNIPYFIERDYLMRQKRPVQ